MSKKFGKDFYRKGNSVKRSGPFSEPPDSENRKVAVLIPFPKISSYSELLTAIKRKSKRCGRYTTPRSPGCSYTPGVAISAVSTVSQACRSYTPPPPKGPCCTGWSSFTRECPATL